MNWTDGRLGDGTRSKGKAGWKRIHRISVICRVGATISIVVRLMLNLLSAEEVAVPSWLKTVVFILVTAFLLVAIFAAMIESD